MAGKTCEICGKPSGMYPICKDCFKLRDEEKIEKCEICNTWHYTNKPCKCKTEDKIVKINDSEIKCIICNEPSNGKHFCYRCYTKYKDRNVDIRIKNCKEIEILDEYGNLIIKCDDGKKVRSRAEALISNWFFKEKIRAIYEQTVYYVENGETKELHPDFYLPDFDIYIEYNELKSKPYLKEKEYAKKIYEKENKKVIIMTERDLEDIDACLKPQLLKIK